MAFKITFCDPFKKDIVDLGESAGDDVVQRFEGTDWAGYLSRMSNASESDIFYSPSFGVENMESRHGLSISAVGEPGSYEFYIFYKRPKKVKKLFGLMEKLDDNYLSDRTGQTKEDAIECLRALLANNADLLAVKIGE
ncbi:hypothetical protein [Dinghuibacter silviterrae]|uniref:Uncharacterized protein n=1 Tax=Dinghuibacter silviterrae TaxID=1539049 RepID=A0A4V3GLF4_9BACT|nr:hypothetical protein [Dinghuibacter silviterrae]TDW99262.1 hypothetical protein EDB95_0271 [Dinghuibacter silviterrae]